MKTKGSLSSIASCPNPLFFLYLRRMRRDRIHNKAGLSKHECASLILNSAFSYTEESKSKSRSHRIHEKILTYNYFCTCSREQWFDYPQSFVIPCFCSVTKAETENVVLSHSFNCIYFLPRQKGDKFCLINFLYYLITKIM